MATLDEIKNGLDANLSSKILDGLPLLRHSTLDVLSSTVAFLQYSTEIALQNKFDTLTPLSSVGETLDGWGAFAGVARLDPTVATGSVILTGNQGTTVPAGTVLTRCDGYEYTTDVEFTFPNSGEFSVDVSASTSGPEGNLASGGVLDLGTVAQGLALQGISQGIGGGANTEDDESYRVRIINSLRNRCRSGTVADYEFWTRLYAGVTRVCVIPKGNGAGTVKVYFMMEDTYADGLPLASDLTAVNDLLFGVDGFAPLGVCGEVCAPEIVEIDVVLTDAGPVTTDLFAEIETSLENSIRENFSCLGGRICKADLEIELRQLLPETCFKMTVPSDDFTLSIGQFPVLGNLTVL